MEHIDHVVGHSLLRYDHLLATIDDEVAALVIATILAILDPLMLIQIFELTKVAPEHDWHLSDEDPSIILLEEHLLDLSLAHACLWAVIEVVFELLFAELDICVDLSGICQVAHSGFVREDWLHTIVTFHDSR